mmetsp:Transcript_162491/g.520856  ORF Transcript_162491/g.520856 Transcript_162491/m.520856 type:complete len:353 (-) Transcript_162491:1705-2763(-)
MQLLRGRLQTLWPGLGHQYALQQREPLPTAWPRPPCRPWLLRPPAEGRWRRHPRQLPRRSRQCLPQQQQQQQQRQSSPRARPGSRQVQLQSTTAQPMANGCLRRCWISTSARACTHWTYSRWLCRARYGWHTHSLTSSLLFRVFARATPYPRRPPPRRRHQLRRLLQGKRTPEGGGGRTIRGQGWSADCARRTARPTSWSARSASTCSVGPASAATSWKRTFCVDESLVHLTIATPRFTACRSGTMLGRMRMGSARKRWLEKMRGWRGSWQKKWPGRMQRQRRSWSAINLLVRSGSSKCWRRRPQRSLQTHLPWPVLGLVLEASVPKAHRWMPSGCSMSKSTDICWRQRCSL